MFVVIFDNDTNLNFFQSSEFSVILFCLKNILSRCFPRKVFSPHCIFFKLSLLYLQYVAFYTTCYFPHIVSETFHLTSSKAHKSCCGDIREVGEPLKCPLQWSSASSPEWLPRLLMTGGTVYSLLNVLQPVLSLSVFRKDAPKNGRRVLCRIQFKSLYCYQTVSWKSSWDEKLLPTQLLFFFPGRKIRDVYSDELVFFGLFFRLSVLLILSC